MIKSPLLREIEERGRMEAHVADIAGVLEERFGEVPSGIRSRLSAIEDEEVLARLVRTAAGCPDLAAFRSRLPD
jgi:hypothetical protein